RYSKTLDKSTCGGKIRSDASLSVRGETRAERVQRCARSMPAPARAQVLHGSHDATRYKGTTMNWWHTGIRQKRWAHAS
ncbi:uncharacterized, partial [Tachysurus ichikawai]